jgi:hypothetical protein
MVLDDFFVLLELALYLFHGFFDRRIEVVVTGFAELVEIIARHVQVGHVLVVFEGNGPAGMELTVEKTLDLAGLIREEILDVGSGGLGVLEREFHLHSVLL